MFKTQFSAVLLVGLLSICNVAAAQATKTTTLAKARKSHEAKFTQTEKSDEGLDEPDEEVFKIVKYPSEVGDLKAYLGVAPDAEKKHPAIVWLVGGFPVGGADSSAWRRVPRDNDQSAKAWREAGFIMMYPTLRGSFGNPGHKEYFYGEASDVVAAGRFLAAQKSVDPKKVYLGGHSTGGTLALLAAELDDVFAGVISFGPVADPMSYGRPVPFDSENQREKFLRSPLYFLEAISAPTLVLEGKTGNADDLANFKGLGKNPNLVCAEIANGGHFDILASLNKHLAETLAKEGPSALLKFNKTQLGRIFDADLFAQREADDLRLIAHYRSRGFESQKTYTIRQVFFADGKAELEALTKRVNAQRKTFKTQPILEFENEGSTYYRLDFHLTRKLFDFNSHFRDSTLLMMIARELRIDYDGWSIVE